VGRPRFRWLDQVEEDLQKMKVRNWREKSKDSDAWNKIVKQAKTHQGLQRRVKKKRRRKSNTNFRYCKLLHYSESYLLIATF
jgi:uncharacterized phage-associated protein